MAENGAVWSAEIYKVLREYNISQIGYVPDAGHSVLIKLALADDDVEATVLTTEEEGIGLLAGAWLGGQRGASLSKYRACDCVTAVPYLLSRS